MYIKKGIRMEADPIGLEMALKFASWGWKVIPAWIAPDGSKVPLLRDWPNKATVSSEVLRGWWNDKSWGHPGIVSGVGSAIVIDADGSEAVSWLRELSRNTGGIGNTLCYRTPGRTGGLHIIGAWPTWLSSDFRQAKVVGVNGEVQIRGNGHFTMSIGCKRRDGEYTLVQEPLGIPGEIPRSLLEEIISHAVVGVGNSYGGSGMEEVSPSEAWEGAPWIDGRKNLLAGLAWYLAIRGEDSEKVLSECLSFALGGCEPPLEEGFVHSKVEYTIARAESRRAQRAVEMERELSGISMWRNRR